jgi:hypothetical protein
MLVVRNDRTKTAKYKTKKKTSCLILRFPRKLNKSRVLSWLTGAKSSVVENKRILSSTYFSRCEPKSLKKILLQSLRASFRNTKKLFVWENLTKSKTPGLSLFSKERLSFPPTLSQKKVRTLDLDFVHGKTQSQKKRVSSIHKVSQSEQVILIDASSPAQLLK